MNISKETILRLSDEYLWGFDNKNLDFADELGELGQEIRSSRFYTKEFIDKHYDYICKNAEVICITSDVSWITGGASVYYGIRINAPKHKEMTLEYIHERIEKSRSNTGVSLYSDMDKFVKKYKVPATPTSFGLSIWTAYRNCDKGIQYTTRTSSGGWCYNWVISKKQSNIALIKETNNYIKSYSVWKL